MSGLSPLRVDATLHWSDWVPLQDVGRTTTIPALPGLYRIGRVGFNGLDYVGQTGTTLRIRLGMLRGVYADQIPYRDPHTAGPGLWALRHSTGCDFQVSACPVEGSSDPWRKGLECVAISLYRQQTGQSPTINFGRVPIGYRISSGNSARLAAAGKVVRGGVTDMTTQSHIVGVPPAGPLTGDPQAQDWCGHVWSGWVPIAELPSIVGRDDDGLYRLRGQHGSGLLYIGEGRILSRVTTHIAKIWNTR